MTYATQARARRLVERLGGTLTSEYPGSWNADAPPGYTWDGDLHAYAVDTTYSAADAWADLIDRIDEGAPMQKCTGEEDNCKFYGCISVKEEPVPEV
jgi:hypothetical protein